MKINEKKWNWDYQIKGKQINANQLGCINTIQSDNNNDINGNNNKKQLLSPEGIIQLITS